MGTHLFKYTFNELAPMEEVEATFVIAVFATESIHGESATRLLAEHAMDLPKRKCVIDATTALGMDLNRLFVGFLNRQFGEDSFTVERIVESTAEHRAGKAC